MEFNNPAKRLHTILTDLTNANPQLPTSSVLASVFHIADDPKKLMHAVVQFHQLVAEVVDFAMEKTNLPTAPLLRYIPQIESAVAFTNYDAAWSNYRSRITPECLVTVEMIAYVEHVEQDQVVSEEELVDLGNKLNDLFNLISSANGFDKDFKHFLLKQIEHIRRAIQEFRISGSAGFTKYLETLIFETSKFKETIQVNQQKNPESVTIFKEIVTKVTDFAKRTKDGVKFLKDVKDTYSNFTKLLPSSSEDVFITAEMPEITSAHEIA